MGNNETGNIADSDGEKKSGFHISKEPVVHGKPAEDVHKYEATIGEPTQPSFEPPLYEDLGTLPATYGSRSLFLIARDPRWLFSYWDIDWEAYPSSRMQGGKVVLKVCNADGGEVYSADIDPDARNWYVPVSQGNATFYAEIGFFNETRNWEVIARSNDAQTPSDSISEVVSDNFATVPYHLAFQKVLSAVKASMGEGESMLNALARIQNEGRKLIFILGAAPEWTDEQRRLLAALLGNEAEEILGLSSVEIDVLLRRQLKERLFSELGSGLLAQTLGTAEGSLFSALSAFGSWSEVSSWAAGAQSSLLSSWLSSWGGGGAEFSSWLASWGGASESAFWSSFVSSWAGGQIEVSSWLSSWGELRGAEFWSSFLSSWQAGAGASEVSSFWSSWLSSWSLGIGPSSAFGSQEFGASWSAQPFGIPREFFMHVNAEVIFYGGTHPDAKVWVDGKPITLNPDGTFRYHFKFPDGDYTIPIVAESPDGVERRAATLRFERNTALRGNVTATPQPEFLGEPLGKG